MPERCKGVPMYTLTLSAERCAKGTTGLRKAGTPQQVADFVRTALACDARERFYAIYLDNRNSVLGAQEVSVGALSEALADPRVILAPAVMVGAAAIILAHNHPSGVADPSPQDLALTRQLAQGASLLGIRLLDHLIITSETYTSLQMLGHLRH